MATKNYLRYIFVFVILAALVLTGTVFAEGETPPEGTPSEPVITVEQPISEEPTPATPESAAEQPVPTEEITPPEQELLSIVETAPVEEIPVEVVETPVELSTEEVLALTAGDPWWKVGSKKYSTNFIGDCPIAELNITCWESATPINLALTKISGGLLPTDRKLYVEAGSYSDVINIDGTGSNLAQMKGLIGVPSTGFGEYYTSYLTGSVTVQYVTGGFTLSGFEISGDVTFNNNKGKIVLDDLNVHDSSLGIRIHTQSGAIKLNKVRADNNGRGAASLDNTFGAAAPIEVYNSSFNNNMVSTTINYPALYITTHGKITINGISASNNLRGDGVDIYNASSVTIKNSVFSSNASNPDSDSWGYGLFIWENTTNSNITLENVVANSNGNDGIQITTLGKISLKDVVASSNTKSLIAAGVHLDNCVRSGTDCLGSGTVTISGTSNHFDSNSTYGLFITSRGKITVSNLTADFNLRDGMNVSNAFTNAAAPIIIKTSKTTDQNTFNNNGAGGNWDGILLNSNGAVTIQNVYAIGNTAYGLSLQNPSAGLSKTLNILRSHFDSNHYGGAYLNTNSPTIITDSGADFNDTWGLQIDTDGSVRITCTGPLGTCSFSYNATGDGLNIYARKSITITKIVANYNGNGVGDDGMDLNSYFTPSPISLTNVRVEGNFDYGIKANTESNVILNSVLARYNTIGVSIGETDLANNVTVLGTNLFDYNDAGLMINSIGKVSISGVTAQNQTNGNGITVNATGAGKTVTLKNIFARNNIATGIYISADGNMTLNSVSSFQNGNAINNGDGLQVVNNSGDTLTINNSNFSFNFGNGLDVDLLTLANLKLKNVNYYGNDANGDGNANLFFH
jgi:hypothetical protein